MEYLWFRCQLEKGLSALPLFSSTHSSQGFRQYVEAEDPDILLITETKVRLHLSPLINLTTRR